MKKTKQFKARNQLPKLEKSNDLQQETKPIIANDNVNAIIWLDQQIKKNSSEDNLLYHLEQLRNKSRINCENYSEITNLILDCNQEANVVLFTGSETAFEQLFNLVVSTGKQKNKLKLIVHHSKAIKSNDKIDVYPINLESLRHKQIAFIPLEKITEDEIYYTLLQTNSMEELATIWEQNASVIKSTRKYIVLKYDKTEFTFQDSQVEMISSADKQIQKLRTFIVPKKKKAYRNKRIELEIPRELLVFIDRNKSISKMEWEKYWLKMLEVWFMKNTTNISCYLKDIVIKTQAFLKINQENVTDSVKLHMLEQLRK
ncbi:MAG: hypothetical protein ACRDCC_07660 [Culicoidibacterales bacterium]